MSKNFTRTFRVRWSELNAVGQVDLAGYFRYLIETAWDWGAAHGLSIAVSEELGFVWVIRETKINLYRPLQADQIFDFSIWLVKWRRVRGIRCFELRLKGDGDLVADGVQQIVTLDSQTLRPVSPPEHLMEKFRIENPRIIQPKPFPKFQTLPESANGNKREVEWRDLDSFEHVNNASYAEIAEDAVAQALADAGWSPSDFKAQNLAVLNQRAHIQYQAPALWGDTLDVSTYLVELKPAGGTWYIEIRRASDEERIIQCTIEWSLVDRVSQEVKPLPDILHLALKKGFSVA